jgi:hypothetical protein
MNRYRTFPKAPTRLKTIQTAMDIRLEGWIKDPDSEFLSSRALNVPRQLEEQDLRLR